jgi:hypothetical protein
MIAPPPPVYAQAEARCEAAEAATAEQRGRIVVLEREAAVDTAPRKRGRRVAAGAGGAERDSSSGAPEPKKPR